MTAAYLRGHRKEAAVLAGRGAALVALVAVIVQAGLHLAWHLGHLEMITATGALNTTGLVVVLAVVSIGEVAVVVVKGR